MEPHPDVPTSAAASRRDNRELRAGDEDRQKVADRLKTAVEEGRLTLDEYDERLGAAYAARTYGELAVLTADLPAPPRPVGMLPGDTPSPTVANRPHWQPYARWSPWRPWLTVSLITTAIWFLTGLDSDGFSYFWPIWVIVPWGLVLASRTAGYGGRRYRGHC